MPAKATQKIAENGEKKLVIEVTQKRKAKPRSPAQLAHLEKVKWKPGQSGNPEGRRVLANIKEVIMLAREYTDGAIRRLGEIMVSRDIPAACRAAEALLDRAWGRSPQTIELTGKDGGAVAQKLTIEIPGAAQLAPRVIEMLQKVGALPRVIEAAAQAVQQQLTDSKDNGQFEEMR